MRATSSHWPRPDGPRRSPENIGVNAHVRLSSCAKSQSCASNSSRLFRTMSARHSGGAARGKSWRDAIPGGDAHGDGTADPAHADFKLGIVANHHHVARGHASLFGDHLKPPRRRFANHRGFDAAGVWQSSRQPNRTRPRHALWHPQNRAHQNGIGHRAFPDRFDNRGELPPNRKSRAQPTRTASTSRAASPFSSPARTTSNPAARIGSTVPSAPRTITRLWPVWCR